MKILRIYLPAICILLTCSCKKFVENQKKQAVMSIITNGQWKVQSYLVDTTEITGEFDGYTFKFNEDGTVTGSNGSMSESGTWVGDVTDYSITSEFPSAPDPVKKLNGHWIIKDSGISYVKADLSSSGIVSHLWLTKIP